MEIEKKFTIKSLPEDLASYPVFHMEQGYLCKGPIVRIRKSNEDYILTYKSKTALSEKDTQARISNEVELPLNKEAYLHLRDKIDGRLVEKDRYKIPLEEGLIAELDIFHGYLEGLCFVEVEFSSTEQAMAFQAPDWFGEDVSLNPHYSNSYLSTISRWTDIQK